MEYVENKTARYTGLSSFMRESRNPWLYRLIGISLIWLFKDFLITLI